MLWKNGELENSEYQRVTAGPASGTCTAPRRPDGSSSSTPAPTSTTGRGVEARHHPLEPVWERDVVRVHACNALPAHLVEAEVEGSREPSLTVAAHDPQAIVPDRVEDDRRLVRRPVVDDHELEVRHRLLQHALERRAKVASPVVDGDQNRDCGIPRHDVP